MRAKKETPVAIAAKTCFVCLAEKRKALESGNLFTKKYLQSGLYLAVDFLDGENTRKYERGTMRINFFPIFRISGISAGA